MTTPESIAVNGREYAWPERPLVAVCVDGCEPDYLDRAIGGGHMPFMARARAEGTDLLARSVVPSFTNPNNLSIVTGAPPAVHGIAGNYFLDPETGEEVMMNDPALLRCGTILAAFAEAGARVAAVTAKDKLRGLLGHGLPIGPGGAICLSAEHADRASPQENGIGDVLAKVGLPLPSVYSAGLSEFVFATGVHLMESLRPDVMYLSTTDYVQHKHAPGTPQADAFYAMMDRYLGVLDGMGATIAITADHGMNAKHGADGRPNVIYLQDLLDGWLGDGVARVILPITDPYVAHHGALGSFATVYLEAEGEAVALAARLAGLEGVQLALSGADAAARFELPADRIGDVVVVSEREVVLGTSEARHDLTGLDAPLRSHGGITEETVPLIVNRAVRPGAEVASPRNFDLFDLALNRVA